MPPKRALIIDDGATSAALSGCRALAADGWKIGIGSPDRSTLTRSSRFVDRWHRVPSPEVDLDGFLGAVVSACADGSYELVFGTSDAQVLTLSRYRDRFGALVPYAGHDIVERSFDKLEIVRAAQRVGLRAPRTEEATPASLGSFLFPAVVKSKLQWPGSSGGQSQRLHTAVASDRYEAAALVTGVRAGGGDPLLQERVVGGLMAVGVVTDPQGRILGILQQRSPYIYPMDVGSSARAISVPVDTDLADRIEKLLLDLGWIGMVQIQFLRSSEDEEPHLIDLNGRFYGSMPLAAAAGCNFAATWAASASGRPTEPLPDAVTGTRFQSLESDLRRAFEVRNRGLIRDVLDCLRFAPGAVHCHWSNRDPLPGIRFVLRLLGRGFRKIFGSWLPRSSTS